MPLEEVVLQHMLAPRWEKEAQKLLGDGELEWRRAACNGLGAGVHAGAALGQPRRPRCWDKT